ncbi:hypothetical protein HYV84_03565 [Candidatus Woesearchaeota archaeon]|nr:hypothetical protein [Candidatus Woesearchaeota archaeon]
MAKTNKAALPTLLKGMACLLMKNTIKKSSAKNNGITTYTIGSNSVTYLISIMNPFFPNSPS